MLLTNSQTASVYIASDAVLKGEIHTAGEVFINGVFKGSLDAKHLTVGEKGYVSGNVKANTVLVHGRIEQKLVSTENLHIFATGQVTGEVSYSCIEVQTGGKLEGMVIHERAQLNGG